MDKHDVIKHMGAGDKFKEMAIASKDAIENFNDFAEDRAMAWAFEEIKRLTAQSADLAAEVEKLRGEVEAKEDERMSQCVHCIDDEDGDIAQAVAAAKKAESECDKLRDEVEKLEEKCRQIVIGSKKLAQDCERMKAALEAIIRAECQTEEYCCCHDDAQAARNALAGVNHQSPLTLDIAAARAAYERYAAVIREYYEQKTLPWDELHPSVQNAWHFAVKGVVK